MAEEVEWFVGIDWASESHQVCLVDARGECLGERIVAHGGAGIEELCDWLIARTGAPTPGHCGGNRTATRPGGRSLAGARLSRPLHQCPSSWIGCATASPSPAPKACPREGARVCIFGATF